MICVSVEQWRSKSVMSALRYGGLSSNNPAPFDGGPFFSAWFLRRARAAERWSPLPRPTVVSLVSFSEAQRRDLQRSRRRPHTAASLLFVLASHAVPEPSRAIAAA